MDKMYAWRSDDASIEQPDYSESWHQTDSYAQPISVYCSRPNKILKPTSRHQSPRNSRRRRMTASVPTRTRSVAEPRRNSNSNTNQQTAVPPTRSTRPISWHANSMLSFGQYPRHPTEPQSFHRQQLDLPRTTYAHGLVTPSCDPVKDDRHMHDLIPTLNALTTYDDINSNGQFPPSNVPVIDWHNSNLGTNSSLSYTADLSAMYPWPSNISTTYDITTAPSSPAFFPFPDMGPPLLIDDIETATGEELVGMGLYDSPAEVQSALIFGGEISHQGKKSLKLEESFEPHSSDVEDNEELGEELDPNFGDFMLSAPHPAPLPASHTAQPQLMMQAMVPSNVRSSMGQFPGHNPPTFFYEDMSNWI